LRKVVFTLALPVLLEQFLSFCVGFYDTYLSGRIGAEATTAVGLAAYLGWLASMLFMLVGTGTTALVARFWGAGEFAQANNIMNRSLTLAGLLGTAVFTLICIAAEPLAGLLDMSEQTTQIAVRYVRLDAIGLLFTSLSLVGAAAMRGAGDMRSPMFILGWVSVFNVVASTLLVYGFGPIPPMGIDGIVAGTVLARFTGGVWMIVALVVGRSGLKLAVDKLSVEAASFRRILHIGGPAGLDGAITWAGHFVFLMIVANLADGPLQTATFAAHIIGIRVEAITYLPAVAWGSAAATLIGQSLGAGDRQRAIRVGHEAAGQCSVLAVIITALFFFQAAGIYTVMHEEAAVRSIGIPAFRMLAFFQVPLVLSIVYVMALRGAGDTRFPLWLTVIGVLGVRLPVAYVCGIVLQGGLVGAWIGMCADMAFRGVALTVRYLRGRWLATEV
jgi:putative MATE family efflux protein